MKGKCKWFNLKRGYGFITGEDGADYFVHYANVQMEGYKKLRDAQNVEFEASKNEKGSLAMNVKPLDGGVEPSEKKPHQHSYNKGKGGAKNGISRS